MKRLISAIAMSTLAALVAAGCGGSAESKEAELSKAWSEAGLEVGEFEALEEHEMGEGAQCRAGTVGGIEATICYFESADEARAGRTAGLERVGETTGAALVRDRTLLIVADREGADPEGKTLNEVTKTFLDGNES